MAQPSNLHNLGREVSFEGGFGRTCTDLVSRSRSKILILKAFMPRRSLGHFGTKHAPFGQVLIRSYGETGSAWDGPLRVQISVPSLACGIGALRS
jgi:hypothetical protein